MASVYDPNFEFNAPKFHDFTNPCQDDDADAFFETCDHESLPTGQSSMHHVTAQMDEASSSAEPHPVAGDTSMDVDAGDHGSTDDLDTAKENASQQVQASSSAKSAIQGGKAPSKLTENILALADFKAKEAELTKMAQGTVASLNASPPSLRESLADAPVSSRTRSSNEGVQQKRGASKTPRRSSSARKGRHSDDKKRGVSASAPKSSAKKARTNDVTATPTFARFARGRAAEVSATPTGRRSSSAPATGRPSMSPSLLRATASSNARASVRSASSNARRRPSSASVQPQLTVPVSPKLSSSIRSARKRSMGMDSSHESLSDISVGRLSTSSLRSVSRESLGGSVCKLTVPKSPNLRTSVRSRKSSATSTDDAKMKEALEAVENLKKRRKMGEERLRSLKSTGGSAAAHSTKELTIPQGPSFLTDVRPRARDASAAPRGDVLLREGIERSERKGRSKTPVSRREGGPPALTEPKTPNFSSFRRTNTKVKSHAEREEELMEEARKNRFKARPLNRSALDSCGDVGVPKVARKALTQPFSPNLSTHVRGTKSRSSSMDSLSSLSSSSLNSLGVGNCFRARRVPSTTRTRPASAAPAPERKLTIPKSPNLRSSSRMRSSSVSVSSNSSMEDLAKPFKALEMPDFSARKFVPKHHSGKLTEPEPFKLHTDDRHTLKAAQLSARQLAEQKMQEEAQRHAKVAASLKSPSALASSTARSVSKPERRTLTDPKPFALQSEVMHSMHQAKWSAQVEQQLEEEHKKFSSFHARPVPKALHDPDKVFTPRRSNKPLTEVHEFQLNVDRRSERHQEINQHKADRQRRLAAEKMAEEELRQEEEAREVRRLRQSTVFKAKGVPESVYKGRPSVAHSTRPLTEPVSPHFRTNFRLRSSRT